MWLRRWHVIERRVRRRRSAKKTIEPTATEDSAFVLSRNPVAAKPAERVPVHVGDQWWAFRATSSR